METLAWEDGLPHSSEWIVLEKVWIYWCWNRNCKTLTDKTPKRGRVVLRIGRGFGWFTSNRQAPSRAVAYLQPSKEGGPGDPGPPSNVGRFHSYSGFSSAKKRQIRSTVHQAKNHSRPHGHPRITSRKHQSHVVFVQLHAWCHVLFPHVNMWPDIDCCPSSRHW